MNVQQYLESVRIKRDVRELYNYGYKQQTGALVRRVGSLRGRGTTNKRNAPKPMRTIERYHGGYRRFGAELRREAYIAGCKAGNARRYKASVVLKLQSRVDALFP